MVSWHVGSPFADKNISPCWGIRVCGGCVREATNVKTCQIKMLNTMIRCKGKKPKRGFWGATVQYDHKLIHAEHNLATGCWGSCSLDFLWFCLQFSWSSFFSHCLVWFDIKAFFLSEFRKDHAEFWGIQPSWNFPHSRNAQDDNWNVCVFF